MLGALLFGACTSEPPKADRVVEALTFPGPEVPPSPVFGAPIEGEGYTARPVSLEVRAGFRVGAAYFGPAEPSDDGVVVSVGHFGQGKSGPEAQDIAHRLAARGVHVVIVDTPGLEEWGQKERALDFQRGEANRQALLDAGTSALALQLAGSKAGVEFLEERGATDQIMATGASGGAVLSFYLALVDERIDGVVLAAAPEVPRRPDEQGCTCKVLPGFPGSDAEIVAMLEVPSLWLKESDVPPLAGLPESATWKHVPGEHSYTPQMQLEALAFIDERLGTSGPQLESVPSWALRTAPSVDSAMSIQELAGTGR
ncbi:MAG: hypothetical protein GY884_10230 [Proteobacteria bacterium]|nr:hypothetical protein [Pseudomonadota bacterium]